MDWDNVTNRRFHWTWTWIWDDMIKATQIKINHHENRVSFWKKELADAEARAAPEERRQHVSSMGYNNTVRYQDSRIEECENGLANAQSSLAEYHHWLALFLRDEHKTYQLTKLDAEYFGLEIPLG